MGVTKKNGFSAPYRSLTWRESLQPLVNRNGVLTMQSDVYESGGIVYIPPFTFIQNGLIVAVDSVKSINKPVSLVAPYYILVSAPTTNNVDDLIFSFAQSPKDIQSNECLIAEYDGFEWRQLDYLNTDERIKATEQDRLDAKWDGPVQGLKTILNIGNYENASGLIIDREGYKVRLDATAIFPVLANDPEATYSRVDKVIYRRPIDSYNRIGARKLLLGGTYGATPVLAGINLATNATRHECVRTVVDNSNNAFVAIAEGYGSNITLSIGAVDPARTGFTQALTPIVGVTPTETQFDFAINPGTGECYFVYVQNKSIKFVRTSSTGTVLSGPVTLETLSQDCTNPRIKFDSTGKLLIYFQALLGPSNYQLYFMSCTTTGAIITSQVRITNTSSNIINPDFFVTSDLYIHLVYEETTTGRVYYEIYDDIGTAISTGPLLVTQNVGSTSFGTNSDNASEPKIRVADTKDVFIMFKQVRGGLTGLCIWQNSGAAFSPNLFSNLESVGDYDFFVSECTKDLLIYFNDLTGAQTHFVQTDGLTDSITQVQIQSLAIGNVSSMAVSKDKTGSAFVIYSEADPGTYTNVGATQSVDHIGPTILTGSQGVVTLNSNDVGFTTSGLTHTPAIGERITLTGAVDPLNNVSKIVTAVNAYNYNGTNDMTVVTCDTVFNSSESPTSGFVDAQFSTPDGMAVDCVKTITEKDATRALTQSVLDTDILLTRIVSPSGVILNYIPNPAFVGGPSITSDQLLVYGASDVDWEKTAVGNFTIAANIYIFDLLSVFEYTVQPGSYAMNEGDCLVVFLDGVTANVTPQAIQPAYIPWANSPQILGAIKNGQFVPGLLAVGGGETLDSGESIVIGQDLPDDIRTRLGITGETSFQAYGNTHRINTTDTYPEAITNLDKAAQDHDQDRNCKLVSGGEWSNIANTLNWSADAYVQVPGCADSRNTIPAGSVSLAVGEVAYVTINRTAGAAANLTVQTSTISALNLDANTFVFVRRTSDGYTIGKSFLLVTGQSKNLDAGASNQTLIAVGLNSEADEGPLKIKAITSSKRIRITPTNSVLHDGTIWGDEASGLYAIFAGCQIDLETGNYYGYGDGTLLGSGALLGNLFTPQPFLLPNVYRNYSIGLVIDMVPGDGTATLKPTILYGTDGATTSAPKAVYSGKKLGQVLVQAVGSGTTINNIVQTNVTQLAGGTGSGGGGLLAIDMIDQILTSLPATTATTIDGVTVLSGHLVLFTQAPIAGVYSASVSGVNITWTSLPSFNGSPTPGLGDSITVREGTIQNRTVWTFGSRGWKPLNTSEAELEPTGWVDESQVTLSFNDGTRTLTLTPVGDYFETYQRGKPYRHSSAQSIQISDVEGLHFIYFDEGTLYETTSFTENIIKRYVFVASIQWDVTNQTAVMLGYELHGCEMDGQTHRYLHSTVGTRYASGFGAGDYTTSGLGTLNSDATLSIGGGVIYDEDIMITVVDDPTPANKFEQILSTIAQIPIYYRSGASGYWRKYAADDYPIHLGSARAVFNNPAGPWTTPDAGIDGNYVAMWIFASNNMNEPIVAIMGQREDTSLADAQANNTYESLSFGSIPSLEMKVLYRLIFQTDSTYTNAVKSALREVKDLRRAIDVSLGSYTPSAHSLLSGLQQKDHGAGAVFTGANNVTPPTYTGGLSPSDDDVGKALDTLNLSLSPLKLRAHTTLQKRVIINSSLATLNAGTTLVQAIKDLLITFTGAQIDFQAGNIYQSDGVTLITTFTPATIANGMWRWYAIYLTINGVANVQNQYDMTINVVPASADGASKSAAVSASFGRKTSLKLGQVAIQGAGGSNISNISQADILQLGTGGGGGGGGEEYTEQTVVNNQLTPVNIVDFLVPPTENKAFQAKYSIARRCADIAGGGQDAHFYSALRGGFDADVYCQTILSDGSIVFGGIFSNFYAGLRSYPYLAKFKPTQYEAVQSLTVSDASSLTNFGNIQYYLGFHTVTSSAISLSQVVVSLKNNGGAATGTVEMVVYADSAGLPGTQLGVSSPFNVSNLANTANSDAGFVFTTPIALSAATKYHFVVRTISLTNGASLSYQMSPFSTDANSGTTYSLNAGSSWSSIAQDPYFLLKEDLGSPLSFELDHKFVGSSGFNGRIEDLVIDGSDNIFVGGVFTFFNGNTRNRLIKMSSSSVEDVSFYTNLGTGFGGDVLTLARQADGKILVGGTFITLNGNSRVRIVRLNADGTEDTAFYTNLGSSFNNTVNKILVQSDGKILVGGTYTVFNGSPRNRLIRLNSDGTEDTSFYTNLGTGFNSTVQALLEQTDGSIVVGGNFSTLNGNSRVCLARLSSSGVDDTTFATNIGTGFNSQVYAIAQQSNGRLIIGGQFFTFNGNTRNRIVELDTDGSEIAGFYANIPGGADGIVKSISIHSANRILVTGFFANFASLTRAKAAMIEADVPGPEYLQTGRFSGLYSPKYNDWTLAGFSSEGDDAGLTFSMTNVGQLQYISNDLSNSGQFTFTESILRWTVVRL